MKQIILLNIFCLFISICPSQEDVLFNFQGSHYDDESQSMTMCNLEFRYNVKEDVVFFVIREDSIYAGYLFTKEHRDSMNNMINKYLRWQKKAVEVDAEVDKEINRINLTGFFSYYNKKKKYTNGYSLLKAYFLSQDLGWHQLILKFGVIEDRKNRSIRFKPKNIYLNKDQVLDFQKGFKESYLESFKIKKEKEKGILRFFK